MKFKLNRDKVDKYINKSMAKDMFDSFILLLIVLLGVLAFEYYVMSFIHTSDKVLFYFVSYTSLITVFFIYLAYTSHKHYKTLKLLMGKVSLEIKDGRIYYNKIGNVNEKTIELTEIEVNNIHQTNKSMLISGAVSILAEDKKTVLRSSPYNYIEIPMIFEDQEKLEEILVKNINEVKDLE